MPFYWILEMGLLKRSGHFPCISSDRPMAYHWVIEKEQGARFPKSFESETLTSRLGWEVEAMNKLVGIGGVDARDIWGNTSRESPKFVFWSRTSKSSIMQTHCLSGSLVIHTCKPVTWSLYIFKHILL